MTPERIKELLGLAEADAADGYHWFNGEIEAADLAALCRLALAAGEYEEHIDLMADEFDRIASCCVSGDIYHPGASAAFGEIAGICKRAVAVTRQNVPVVDNLRKVEKERDKLCGEFATLRAERDRLAGEVEKRCFSLSAGLCHDGSLVLNEHGNPQCSATTLKAERDRLREALQKLCEAAELSDDCQYGTLGTGFVRDIATAALAQEGGAK